MMNEKTPIKDLFQDWRKLYRENHLEGTRHILQLCVDLTGYSYVVKLEDVEQSYNLSDFVQENVVKSNFQEVYALAQPAVLERLFKLLEQMIVADSEQLLRNNFWLNQMIRLMVAFCEADEDECNMVGGCLSTFLLVHISAVRQEVTKKLEKASCKNDDDREEQLERQERNLSKSSKLLVRNIETVHRFTNTLPTITDLYCRMLIVYPGFYVENGVGMKVLLKLLQCRHSRTFALILNCFKNLLNRELQSKKVVDAVTRFFLESAQEFFVLGMLNFKTHEKAALEVVLLIQNQFQGQTVFQQDVIDKLRQFMFHADEQVRGYAVDFHVSTLCSPEDDQGKDGDVLLHILKLYVTYEHSLESLFSLIGYLWQLDFFETWDVLSDLLATEAARKDNFFLVHTIVLVVNRCHELLMQSFESGEQQPVDREKLRRLVKSFMRKYPASLRSCIPYERAYSELLKPASAEHHRKLMRLQIDVEPYYEALFDVLETVARTCTDFCMLNANLKVIRSYASVIVDTEQIWSELMAKHAGAFIEARQKITSANVGKDPVVNETYYHCMVRLTAILELDHDVGHTNLSSLIKMAVNDFNLLDKFKFSKLQTAMFYRFYKSTFYTLLHAYQAAPSHDSGVYADLPRFSGQRLKRRVLELLRILIKHLGQYDEPLEICLHQFTTLVDMLLMTQPDIAELDITELASCEYHVEPSLLERMAKYLLNYLISKEYATHDLAVQTQKQLLEKYIHLYRNHRSLPRITDTYHIVANFCFPTVFEEQLKRLMLVLHRSDPSEFYEVISRAAFQLLLFYKSEASVKNLFKKFLAFATSGGFVDGDEEEGARVISRVVEKILNYLMGVVIVNPDEVLGAKKMLKLIEPMLAVMPGEELVKMEHLLVRRQEYEGLEPAERKAIGKFVKILRKCADA